MAPAAWKKFMDKSETIRPREGLQLRKVGRQHMIVEVCSDNVNMTNVYTLNESAALLWRRLSDGSFSVEELAAWLGELYGLDKAAALADVAAQIEAWRGFGLLAEGNGGR